MRSKKTAAAIVVLALVMAAALAAGQKTDGDGGEDSIPMNTSGSKGVVVFPHPLHEEEVGECMTCHNLYPPETNAVQTLIEQQRLRKQQVMKTCLDCHRRMADIDARTGPIACQDCHVR